MRGKKGREGGKGVPSIHKMESLNGGNRIRRKGEIHFFTFDDLE